MVEKMIDGIGPKLRLVETAPRKNASADASTVETGVTNSSETKKNGVALSAALIALDTKPPIDKARIQAIRFAIQNNDYPLDFDKLAGKMIESQLFSESGRY
jgi:flagellar biosynthesis anti-sigma factor FlgM